MRRDEVEFVHVVTLGDQLVHGEVLAQTVVGFEVFDVGVLRVAPQEGEAVQAGLLLDLQGQAILSHLHFLML